ncbi:MAG TPA: hypothetical protein VG106_13260 [Vicinamibacterales bacterium]|nr:hypothetical protein [Vicinamibacterales bacterium]
MRIASRSLRVLAAVALSTVTMASSSEAQGKLRGMARLGGEVGGEKVLEFQYADGSTPEMTAGGGLLISVGAALEVFKAVDAQVNAGWKYRTIPEASNQDASWNRFPVEAMLFYRTPLGLRLGGGATVHLGNVLEASGDVLNDRVEFKTNPGFLLQAEYVIKNFSFDVRYTSMKYEVESGGTGTVDASSFGAGFSFLFGR